MAKDANIKINIDVKNSMKSIEDLQLELKYFKKELNTVAIGSKKFDKLKASVDKTKNSLNKATGASKKMATGMKANFKAAQSSMLALGAGVAVVLGALKKVGDFLGESIELYNKQIEAETQLTTALGGTSQALLNQASALQLTTKYGDEATIKAQGLLASFGATEKEILQLTPQIQNYASVMGISLDSAAKKIGNTIYGTSTTIKGLNVQFTTTTSTEEKLAGVTEALTEQYDGQAEAVAILDGGITQYNNAIGDTKETVGLLTIALVDGLLPSLAEQITKLNGATQAALKLRMQYSLTLKQSTNAYYMQQRFNETVERGIDVMNEDVRATFLEKFSEKFKIAGEDAVIYGKLYDKMVEDIRVIQEADNEKEANRLKKEAEKNQKSLDKKLKQEQTYQLQLQKLRNEIALGYIDDEYEKELTALEQKYQLEYDAAFGQNEKLLLLQEKFYQDIDAIDKKYADKKAKEDAEKADFLRKIEDKKIADEIQADIDADNVKRLAGLDNWERKKEQIRIEADYTQMTAKELADKLSQIDKEKELARKSANQETLDQSIELGKSLVGALDQFGKESKGKRIAMALSQFAIDTAMAISSLMASSTANPLNSVTFGSAGIAQFTAGMIQIGANIATATAALSKAEKGGKIGGKSHQLGGTIIEAEAGESIINKKSTRMFAPVLSAINQAGGGVAIDGGGSGLIDYDLLASKINDKKVYVVSGEMTNQQGIDVKVKDRAKF